MIVAAVVVLVAACCCHRCIAFVCGSDAVNVVAIVFRIEARDATAAVRALVRVRFDPTGFSAARIA